MAELIPALSACLSRMTTGEKRLARRLEALLEDDYLCWYDIPVGRKNRYPDFIILHPGRGLLLLEVKDWRLDSIRKLSTLRVEIDTPKGRKTVANPIEQARQCTYQVVKLLEHDPRLIQASGQHAGKLKMPWGYGVVLPNINRAELTKALTADGQHLLPAHLLICKDEMKESSDAEEFQQRLWGMFNYSFGNKLSLPEIERIRWHLFPELRIDVPQGEIFPLPQQPAADTLGPWEQAAIPDMVKVMDLQQEQLARSMGEGHRIIHGVAGSGKTMILGFRSLKLAEVLQKPVLILCFNVSLAARLRAFAAGKCISDKVQAYHFHDWCGQQLKLFHCDVPAGNKPYWERQVEAVIAAVDQGKIPRAQYGAVLIDEGHDFEPDWLRLVVQMIDPVTNSLLLLYDDAQSIYRKKKPGLDFSLSSVGIQARGRTSILKFNYRNTRDILDFAYRFAEEFIGAHDSDDDHIPILAPESAGGNGPVPVFKQFVSESQEIEYVARCITQWLAKGHAISEIGVLAPSKPIAKRLSDALTKRGIAHLCMTSKKQKSDYSPLEPRLNILTFHSSKGLEFKTVVLMGVDKIQNVHTELADQVRLMYVGMTRAREQLLMTASKATVFTERLAQMVA